MAIPVLQYIDATTLRARIFFEKCVQYGHRMRAEKRRHEIRVIVIIRLSGGYRSPHSTCELPRQGRGSCSCETYARDLGKTVVGRVTAPPEPEAT